MIPFHVRLTTSFLIVSAAAAVVTALRFTQLAASSMHVGGVSRDGAVYCWGDGGDGRLGTGDESDQVRPAAVAAPS